MPAVMIVQLPVTVAYGTDEEFDLRVRLHQELATALQAANAGECATSEIDTAHIKFHLQGFLNPTASLNVVKDILSRAGLLSRAVVLLETRNKLDSDDHNWQVLWPQSPSGIVRSA
jgi:hypothetical protein